MSSSPAKKLVKRFGFTLGSGKIRPRYNIMPRQQAPVLIMEEGKRVCRLMSWGLNPPWTVNDKWSFAPDRLINIESEKLLKQHAFSFLLAENRCLVLADGFFLWDQKDEEQLRWPHYVTMKDQEPFAMAGLWISATTEGGETIDSFTILTCQANRLSAKLGDRMPVILRKKDEDVWLGETMPDVEAMTALSRPYPSKKMEAYPVSNLVTRGFVDRPEIISPI